MTESYLMKDNNTFVCPLTGKEFPFADRESRKAAHAEQQQCTAAEKQRLERLAGKTLPFRELRRASSVDAKAKEVEDRAKGPVQQATEHPFVTQVYKGISPYIC